MLSRKLFHKSIEIKNNETLYEFWNQQITDKWINSLFPVLDIAEGKKMLQK